MNQQENASAPQPTQPQDTAPTSQPAVTPASVPSPASPSHVSAPWPTPQQQYLAMMLQPKSPTEVLANRLPHANGVTWVFQDLATGMLRHVDLPNVPSFARRQSGQGTTQSSPSNEMVLYQSPSNQPPQQATQTASATQPMTSPSVQLASATLPLIPSAPQATSAGGQQIDWTSKIAEVMRDQFGLKPKQQNLMYRTPNPTAYDQLPLPHKYKLPDFTMFSGQGEVSTVEHINRYIVHCGEAAQHDALKVCLFSMSLSGSAFTWFTTLPANSIIY